MARDHQYAGKLRTVTLCAALVLAFGARASATSHQFQDALPVAQAYPLSVAPTVDGQVLGDPAWQLARSTSGFWQVRPGEGDPASQRTEVFVGFTEMALYIGVICHDDDPQAIIVADSRRDASLADSDSFQVILDTFRDKRTGFVFGTNPAGIEFDGQVSRALKGARDSEMNRNWDTTWTVEAAVSDIGWSAELEIPFKSLRYASGPGQEWGINFQRTIRRNNEIAFWAPLSRQHNLLRLSEAGLVRGIEVPAQRNLKITPYALGAMNRGGEIEASRYRDAYGVDLKYSLTPSLTLDATINTDFAQVEVDDVQVNLDRFSVFLPEKRPFFLENAGLFSVGTPDEVQLFFSRRIGVGNDGAPLPIESGLRLSGKARRTTNVGLLHMRTEGSEASPIRNAYSVVRVNQELPNRSSVGAIFVNREGADGISGGDDDDYNRTYAIDGRWGIGEYLVLSGYTGMTDTPGMSSDDHVFSLRGDYSSPRWTNGIGYTEVGDQFNPEVGFLSRRGYRKAELKLVRRYRPAGWWGLHEVRPNIAYSGFWGFDGKQQSELLNIGNQWEWGNGTELRTGVNFSYEGVTTPFDIADGVAVPVGDYEHGDVQVVVHTDKAAPLNASLRATTGGFFGGDRLSLSPTLRYRVGDNLNGELSWNHNDIDIPVPGGEFQINVARLRVSYSFTPKISLQALIQYDDRDDMVATNLRFSWLQSANAGLFVAYNEVDEVGLREPRQELIMKYSRIIDLFR